MKILTITLLAIFTTNFCHANEPQNVIKTCKTTPNFWDEKHIASFQVTKNIHQIDAIPQKLPLMHLPKSSSNYTK